MARIADLVKTYRMLSDPDAPDWNVKFVGAIAIAAIVVAGGAGALLWSLSADPGAPTAAAARTESTAPPSPEADEPACPVPLDGPQVPTLTAACAPAPLLP